MTITLKRCAVYFCFALPVTLNFGGIARADSGAIQLGIDRSSLTLQSQDVIQQTLRGIHDLHAIWFRDVVTSATPKGIANIVDEVGIAKQQRLKVILNVVQLDADFPDYNAGAAKNSCGWSEKPFSRVETELLQVRLTALLEALKKANLSVDAFEIGNEDDQYCYNPDIPNGRIATDDEVRNAVRAYSKFLYVAATTIKNPTFFPQAKVITFGIAHAGGTSGHVADPARFIAMLKNVDGINYIDNPAYHVDGYGTHLYTSPNNFAAFVSNLHQDIDALGRDRPFWVTESGFTTTPQKAFPNKSGQTEWEGIDQLLAVFTSIQQTVPLGPVMFFSYDNWLSDPSGHLLPGAEIIPKYGSKK